MASSRTFTNVYHVYTTSSTGVALATGTYRVGPLLGASAKVYAPTSAMQISDMSGQTNYTYYDAGVVYDGTFKSSNGTNFIGTYQHPNGSGNTADTGNLYLYTNSKYTVGNNVTGFSPNTAEYICYAAGTLIRTTRGDVAVEDLSVGDLAVTASGESRPIRWLGHRETRCDRHPAPRKVWPVRVAAHAFGVGFPYADLWLSPGHALCLGDALVPVRGLIDGDRVAQVEQDEITYWHVELDSHDVLLANGLPAESYLDTGNRRGFANAAQVLGSQVTDLHFDENPAPGYDGSGYCLEMIESGPRLAAIRARCGLGRATASADRSASAASAVHLVVDGIVVAPHLVKDGELRFLLPDGASEVRLVSPSRAGDGADIRRLGILVDALAVSDGAGWREIALDDPGLYAGFHDVEAGNDGVWRWTSGDAHLSPRLWDGLRGGIVLRVNGMLGDKAYDPMVDAA